MARGPAGLRSEKVQSFNRDQHCKGPYSSRERGGFKANRMASVAQPALQKKIVFAKAERMHAAGIIEDRQKVKAKNVAERNHGPEYELSSHAIGAQVDKTNLSEPEPRLGSDCRANCMDGAEKVARTAIAADPTCPHARHLVNDFVYLVVCPLMRVCCHQYSKLRRHTKSEKSVVGLMRQAERHRRIGEVSRSSGHNFVCCLILTPLMYLCTAAVGGDRDTG